ncbi:MAG: N-acetylmuramoyl-L-alanine amidase [Anaerovibrio sp.]|nr:N-acetylmuramoyl-L-alanine amidase [Anaerovibrio sp.]MCR5175985.1 N-acetylmuramoyl-L-alanine amidase [Anaerovibrio sp.]
MGNAARTEAATFAERTETMAHIKAVRVSTDKKHTRIVMDITKDMDFETSVLSNPQRVVVDIHGTWISSDLKKTMNVNSRFVKSVRIAQHDPDTVRVVIESSLGENNRKFFSLKGGDAGHRLVLDFGDFQSGSGGAAIDFGKGKNKDNSTAKSGAESPVNPGDESQVKNDTQGSPDPVKQEEKPVVEPVFTPGIKGKIIAIDPGHGGCDVGAIGPTGVTEKSITLRISKEVQRLLQAEGAEVVMTRSRDVEVSAKREAATDVEELQARCDIANNSNADIFVSIHMDSFTNSTPSGTTGYYYGKGTKASRRLAQDVSDNVTAMLSTGHRGVKSCNFYVVKHTTMPAILLEVAFISNEREERLMNSEAGIKKAAEGIVKGIIKFFG